MGNSIFDNQELGIDIRTNGTGSADRYLPGDGITANDLGDPDVGPNELQNFPVLTSATTSAGMTTISGTLNSTPSLNEFRVEFFSNTVCNGDTLGVTQTADHGEAQTYLGFILVNTDGSGDSDISFTTSAIANATFVTATATDSLGNTSELAQCIVHCPNNNLTLDNTPLPEGLSQAVFTIQSKGTAVNGTSVIFEAGTSINLEGDGSNQFEVEAGALFEARIGGCQ